jgi:ankyrin repeat protein
MSQEPSSVDPDSDETYDPIYFNRRFAFWRSLRTNTFTPSLLCDVNDRFDDGSTPLYTALGCHNETLEYLLQNGADPNQLSHYGSIILLGIANEFQIHLLLAYGADVNRVNRNGQTALFPQRTPGVMIEWYAPRIRVLLENGANPNITSRHGSCLIAFLGCEPIVELLLEYGADVNYVDRFNKSAIEYALNDTVPKLLRAGAFPRKRNSELIERSNKLILLCRVLPMDIVRAYQWKFFSHPSVNVYQ